MTEFITRAFYLTNISTHTPTRGVTQIVVKIVISAKISTHTPTRGVTEKFLLQIPDLRNFNSHAHEGRDVDPFDQSGLRNQFQLTRPRGA